MVQATGLEEASSTVRAIVKSFRALEAFATFDDATDDEPAEDEGTNGGGGAGAGASLGNAGSERSINLGYTINLHLPATSDIAVFNAIFKSLREHILRD